MYDFRPDADQTMLVAAINRFATERVRNVYRAAEEEGAVDADIVQTGWEIGVLPALLSPDYGGFGDYSAVTGALAVEEFCFGDLAIGLQILTPNLVAIPLALAGSSAQRQHYLPAFTQAHSPRVTAALTERTIYFDPYQLKTTATADGASYRISGTKIAAPLADHAETILVWANEGGRTHGFLVPASAPGVHLGERDRWMGINALPTYQIDFENVVVPLDARLGETQPVDFSLILSHSRVALAAAATGMARAAFETARDYAKQRVQFGKPVAQNQSIAFMLADMYSDVESMRMMTWEAAWLLDQGHDATQQCTVLKHFVDQAVLRIADSAVQTLGGYGYIREFAPELYLRNARGFATFDGLAMV